MASSRLKAYLRLYRPRTALSTLMTAIGGSFYMGNPLDYGGPHIPLLIVVGVTLAHFSVNALNDYMDYRSGLDLRTPRTPFSGGTKLLVDGVITPIEALALALASLVSALAIGLYLTLYRGPLVLLLALTGALIIATYNKILVKAGLGEISVWAKGVLVFIGSVYTVTGSIPPEAVLVGMVYGGVSTLILYANFIPDVEADRSVGRRTIPAMLGKKAWIGYIAIAAILAILIATLPLLGALNPLALLALIPLALTPRVAEKLGSYSKLEELTQALATNTKLCRSVDLIITTVIIAQAILK